MRDNAVPVVLLASSQHGALGIIRTLGREGIPVFGVHQSLWEPSAHSRYLRGAFRWDFSSAASADSVSFLMDTARKIQRRPILIPTSDEAALLVAANAGTLAAAYDFATPDAAVVVALSSKKSLYDLCRSLGIPAPQTSFPRDRDEVLRTARDVAYPVVVKGECGEFLQAPGKKARVALVHDEKVLAGIFDLNASEAFPALMVQEYIPGDDSTVWMFNGYFNRRCQCLFAATGRKLRQFPPHHGSTSLGICLANETVKAHTMRLVRGAGYWGPLDLGYRFDARDGQYKLLDVNPRIGASFRLFVAESGLDTALALYLDLTGRAVPSAAVPEGRKWIVESNDLVSSWIYLRGRKIGLRDWLRSLRGIGEGVWFAKDDLLPLFMLPALWFRKRDQRRRLLRHYHSLQGS